MDKYQHSRTINCKKSHQISESLTRPSHHNPAAITTPPTNHGPKPPITTSAPPAQSILASLNLSIFSPGYLSEYDELVSCKIYFPVSPHNVAPYLADSSMVVHDSATLKIFLHRGEYG